MAKSLNSEDSIDNKIVISTATIARKMRGIDLQSGERPVQGCQSGLFKLLALPTRNRASFRLLLLAALLLLSNNDARAGLGCTVTPTNLVFGDVTSAVLANGAATTTGTISYDCTGATANSTIRVCLALGHYNGSNTRSMTSGANTLNYQIYSDAALTQVWGNASDGKIVTVDLVTDASGAASSSSTMYASIVASQTTAKPGSYSQTMSGDGQDRLTDNKDTSQLCTAIGGNAHNISFTTTATISANCNVFTTTMNFGSASTAISSNIDSTATITAQCSNTTPYSIGLDNGTNVSGSQRRMRLGATANYISYNLYTDAARSVSWLATTSTTSCTGGANSCVLATGTGANQNVTVYGRVPSQTASAAGNFSDTILITVTY